MFFNIKENNTFKAILIIILTTLLLVSCTKKQEKPMIEEEKDKIPKNLAQMQESGENIISETEKIIEDMKKEEEQKKETPTKEDEGQKHNEDEGSEEKDGDSEKDNSSSKESENKEQEKKPKTQQEKIDETWNAVKQTSKEIHTLWSAYEITAMEKGIKKEELLKFEDSLDNVTISVDKKDTIDLLTYSNKMNYYMSMFFDMYKEKPDGELMKMRYFARQALLYAIQNEWSKGEEILIMAEESINILRAKIKLDKKDQHLMENLNLSIINMKSSLSKKNVELLKIKRDIVLKNLDQLKEKTH